MRACCDDMQKRLTDTKAKTAGLLNETAELKARGRSLDMKGVVVDSFLKKFQLTQAEIGILVGGAVGEELFAVLQRVKCIHEDCKLLLRTSQQRVGLEIMESMAMHLEEGYERLYHWTQAQCRTMTGDLPSSSPTLRRALQELKERPILYKYCVDEYVLARRSALVQSFIDALTRGTNSGRPIELVSHDPVRYIGDMLGFLHQAIATEKDHISGLFSEDEREWVSGLLASITESAGRPLKMRVEQVLLSTNDPVAAYQMVNMVRYYLGVFRELLGEAAPLMNTVKDLSELQTKLFFSSLTVQTSKLLEEVELPDVRLTPPSKLIELLGVIQHVLASRDISVCSLEDHKESLKQILTTCIDPMIQYCNESASSLSVTNMAVYLINCLYLVHSTVSIYEYTELALEKLDGQIQAHLDTLVNEQAGYILAAVGISDCFNTLQNGGELTDAMINGLQQEIGSKLAHFLSAPDSSYLPQLSLLARSKFKEETYQRGIMLFLSAYEQLFNTVVIKLGEEKTSTIFPHSPGQAKSLIT